MAHRLQILKIDKRGKAARVLARAFTLARAQEREAELGRLAKLRDGKRSKRRRAVLGKGTKAE